MSRPRIMEQSGYWAAALSLGIVFESVFGYPHQRFWPAAGLAAAELAAAVILRRRPAACQVLLAAVVVVLGFLHAHAYRRFSVDHIYYAYPAYAGRRVELIGRIVRDPVQRAALTGTRTSMELEVLAVGDREERRTAGGRVVVQVFRPVDAEYGDIVRLEGALTRPFDFSRDGSFSYRKVLRRRGIFYLVRVTHSDAFAVIGRSAGPPLVQAAHRTRWFFQEILARYLNPTEQGVVEAVLLGDRRNLSGVIRDIFRDTGTSHILAVSGLHVGIVAWVIFLVLQIVPMDRRWRYGIAIALVAGYTLLTGARPPVVRAGIMAAAFLWGFVVEREYRALNLLFVSQILILLLDPMALFAIGFQLSFVSVYFIITGYTLIRNQWPDLLNARHPAVCYLARALVVSLCAWAGVAGLVAYYFHQITPVSILANPAAVPLMTLVVILGAALIPASFAGPAGWALAWCLKAALCALTGFLFWVHRIPGGQFWIRDLSGWHAAGYYIILLAVTVAAGRFSRRGEGGKREANPF